MSLVEPTDLPILAPRTHCVLLPRDPNTIYAYWDYTPKDLSRLRDERIFRKHKPKYVLRVFEDTRSWDIPVGLSARKQYIPVDHDNAPYRVAFGASCLRGHFVPLAVSNTVRTPAKTPSKRDDLIWQDIRQRTASPPYIQEDLKAGIEGDKQGFAHPLPAKTAHQPGRRKGRIYQLSAEDIKAYYMAFFAAISRRSQRRGGMSLKQLLKKLPRGVQWQRVSPVMTSFKLRKVMALGASENMVIDQNALLESFASEALQGGSEARLGTGEFFFEIATELIVHGRTHPDAAVWLNAQGVKLNPDGTFTLRYALPDGSIPLKFIAKSSEGCEQRQIDTAVEREKTSAFQKKLEGYHG